MLTSLKIHTDLYSKESMGRLVQYGLASQAEACVSLKILAIRFAYNSQEAPLSVWLSAFDDLYGQTTWEVLDPQLIHLKRPV